MADLVERVEINFVDMPIVQTPTFSESDVGKTFVAHLNITMTEIERVLKSEDGETPFKNVYLFKINDVTSLAEE